MLQRGKLLLESFSVTGQLISENWKDMAVEEEAMDESKDT
jgi:hypothetical protein